MSEMAADLGRATLHILFRGRRARKHYRWSFPEAYVADYLRSPALRVHSSVTATSVEPTTPYAYEAFHRGGKVERITLVDVPRPPKSPGSEGWSIGAMVTRTGLDALVVEIFHFGAGLPA